MSTVNLIILGLLMHGEKSAYDMVKEFETWNLKAWVKVSNPAIYKNVIKLNKDGYLLSKVVREGEMPEKTIYSINDSGREHFYKLMESYSSKIGNLYFDFSAFLVNINLLEQEQRINMLSRFNEELRLKKEIMERVIEAKSDYPANALMLMGLYKNIFKTLYEWSNDMVKHNKI